MSVDLRADRGGQANMSVVGSPSTHSSILMGPWDAEEWSVGALAMAAELEDLVAL